jgi:hypothetical protein
MNPAPQPNVHALDARTPLLLLPVNIETRFIDGGRQSELWMRIYPDQIAINSHEPELTAQEIADGQTYWDAVWRAGKPPASLDSVKAPWRGLASLYGAPRAAWIALQMTPTNIALQPAAATPDGTAPVPPPSYPLPPQRDSSWTKPAITSALPDAWTVLLVSGTLTASFHGGTITPELAIGLTPGAGGFPAGSPVDAGMQWLVDFDAALAAGMALKIPLTAEQRRAGFDQVFVYGLRSTGDGASDFGSLLDAHHYTDGFALVPQGAPTNNTADASSAYSRKDPDYESSFAAERQDPLTKDPASDGIAFATAIGIEPAHVAHTAYANGTDVESGTDMLIALWAATLGYFLSQMMADVFKPDQIELARLYAIANAIPRGPVPAFRVGVTPYGVLPVTSLSRYRPDQRLTGGSIEPGLVNFIRRLWQNWLSSSAGAPHMQNTGDPDKELAGLLGMDASSMTFRGREILGDGFLWNYIQFLRLPAATINSWWAGHLARGRQLLDSFQFQSWDPRVIHLGMADKSYPVLFATVQTGPLSETDPLNADADLGGGKKGNYIQWLRQAPIDDIRAENYPGPKPTSLLYKILRQSVLFDYVNLSIIAEIGAGRLLAAQVRETEFIGIPLATPPVQPSVSAWDVLARPSGPNPTLSWAEYLVSLDPAPASPFARLAQLRTSLDRLAALPTAELDRLLTETLDACSHRLDVWASAVANSILNRTRAGQVNGVHLGSFGWVEQVRPAAPRAPIQGAELTSVRQMDALRARRVPGAVALAPPLEPLTDNGGFIYAPSLDQAAVAAVLRNGYMTHKGTADEGLLSIDISSERVRRALYLLGGVRQGQNLNALLGYLFEQGLHDVHLDKYAQPFRDRFPIVANKLTPSSDPSESVAASNVVDGVALRTAWDTGQLPAGGNWGAGLPGAGADQNSIITLLQTIDDYADALGDLSMTEAVYQIMRGNFGRAGGLMDAISRGERPPEPDVIKTPRGGLDLTHRILLLFTGTPVVSLAWSSVPKHARALAEPFLDAGLSGLLPDPATVLCNVSYHDGAGNHTVKVRLLDLNVGPLDCLAMADAAEVPQQSELELRIAVAAKIPVGADTVQIDFDTPSPPPGSISFPDFFFLAKSLRSLIGSSRPLLPQDLTLPETKAADLGGVVDLLDLRARAAAAVASLAADILALQTAAAGLPGVPGPVRDALLAASYYGVAGSVPSAITDTGLADQAASVLKLLGERATKALSVTIATAPQDDVTGVFTTVFSDGFTVLPRFKPPDIPSLKSAFQQSASLVSSDPAAPARWFSQLTHVRPAMDRLDSALGLAQTLGAPPPAPVLGQLPAVVGDRWLALPLDPAKLPAKGRIAFACFTSGDPVNQTTYAGLLVDEWPERIPSVSENAAVAFHYEEPKARAPQSLLLAVCPDTREMWDDDLITGILRETLELAKIRTVDLDSVLQVGQILPALYFALNLQSATISTNFTNVREVSIAAQFLR